MADANEVVAFTSMAEGTREDYELLDDPVRGLLESQPATIVLHQANSEVVEGLLGQVGLLDVQPQGVVPEQSLP